MPPCIVQTVFQFQMMLPCSKAGALYSINIESVSAGVPYAESFSILVHYCLKKLSETQTSFVIYAQIKYKKSVWGLVKGTSFLTLLHFVYGGFDRFYWKELLEWIGRILQRTYKDLATREWREYFAGKTKDSKATPQKEHNEVGTGSYTSSYRCVIVRRRKVSCQFCYYYYTVSFTHLSIGVADGNEIKYSFRAFLKFLMTGGACFARLNFAVTRVFPF